MIKVSGQIDVQGTIFTYYPARTSESPECSSCSNDNEQFVCKRTREKKTNFIHLFHCFFLCVLLYVNSVVFLLFWLTMNLRGLWIFAFYSVFFQATLCELFGIYSFEMNFIKLRSTINSEFYEEGIRIAKFKSCIMGRVIPFNFDILSRILVRLPLFSFGFPMTASKSPQG